MKTTGKKEFSYQVLWNADDVRMTLHSYVVKTKSTGLRNVLLLSTLEPINAVRQDDGKQKPQIYKEYDFTKGGTDIIDQRAQFYSRKPNSSRWTISVFSYILDTSQINASTVWFMNSNENPRKIDSMGFFFFFYNKNGFWMGIGEISSCAVCKAKISQWAKQEHTK